MKHHVTAIGLAFKFAKKLLRPFRADRFERTANGHADVDDHVAVTVDAFKS